MSSFAKFIGASLGWSLGGPIGGILGFALGSLIDGFSGLDVKKGNQRQATASGDFEISLLILAAVVIKADGKIDKRELDFVRRNFIGMYGKEKANKAFKLFGSIIKKNDISTRQVCIQIRQHMSHASRLQLLHFLFGIAKADGAVSHAEMHIIKTISVYLYISNRNFESIRAMFSSTSSSSSSNNYTSSAAYKILEITKKVTNAEVKKAYRRLVKKHHPDKLRHLGEEYQKGAEDKFRQIQKAYEQIQKERGM